VSRFLISCGGTGGHLSPGISLAQGLAAKGHSSVLLISMKKVDARLIEKYPDLRFERMPGVGFTCKPAGLVRFILSQIAAVRFCRRMVASFKPDAIVGFGGFTCAPAALVGRLQGIPVALHESNRVPGLAIRVLGPFVNRVYLPIGIRLAGVRTSAIRHAGQPVRAEMVRIPAAAAREALGLDATQKLVVVLGGSQGASALNAWARENYQMLAAENIQLYCVSGLGKGAEETLTVRSRTGAEVKAVFVPFSDRVGELLSAADLVVSRAGAGTLAELIRCEAPAILVPYPHAASDHQRANARFFERQGGGIVVEESAIGGLRSEVAEVVFNEWLIQQFRGNLRRMDRQNALELMLADLTETASRQPSAAAAAGVHV